MQWMKKLLHQVKISSKKETLVMFFILLNQVNCRAQKLSMVNQNSWRNIIQVMCLENLHFFTTHQELLQLQLTVHQHFGYLIEIRLTILLRMLLKTKDRNMKTSFQLFQSFLIWIDMKELKWLMQLKKLKLHKAHKSSIRVMQETVSIF